MITKYINGCYTYLYSANFKDRDNGKCYLPDFECYVTAYVENDGTVEVDKVFLENYDLKDDYLEANSTLDQHVQYIATLVRSLAQNDEDFCDDVRRDQDFEYPKDDYADQHRLRPSDVLNDRSF